jgi:hypothetical protein
MLSMLIFVVFFTAVLIYVFKMDKTYIDKISRIPLDAKDGSEKECH